MTEDIKELFSTLNNSGRLDRKFGFTKKDLKNIQYSEDYRCPECENEPPEIYDEDDMYEVNGEKYPQYYNEIYFSSDMGTIHDWDEVHICQHCGTKFYFKNGCY